MKPLPGILAAILILTAAALVVSGSLQPEARKDAGVSNMSPPSAPHRTRQRDWMPESAVTPERPLLAASAADAEEPALPADPANAPSSSAGRPAPSVEHRKAAAFRRQLRHEGERFDESIGAHVVLQPAAWVDLGDDAPLPPGHHDGIQQIAAELRDKIANSGLDPATPEYRKLWNQAVRESNWKFRARFGARAWTRHHIQAHHMATEQHSRN